MLELDENVCKKLLSGLTSHEIAEDLIENIGSDDAADVISEFPEKKQEEVIALLEDEEQASDIIDLMTYEEGTAGALMGTEMVVVYHNWNVVHAIWEMRKQAEHTKNVYSIYVVDEKDGLLGTLSMKTLIFASSSMHTTIRKLYKQTKVRAVKANTPAKEVVNIMEKYDLVVKPIVNEMNALVGRIPIDYIVDVIKEEADKDYQMASGISGTHPSCLKCSKD
jgi:magnesium transporter